MTDSNSTNLNIKEVWALDGVQHGDSALINEPVLGDICVFFQFHIMIRVNFADCFAKLIVRITREI